jgi:hypothetical protein
MTTLHGQRLRSRSLTHRLTANLGPPPSALTQLRWARFVVWALAVGCYFGGGEYEALLMLVFGVSVSVMIAVERIAGRKVEEE